MLDIFLPLGRPPLDTHSPTQLVRSAEPLPAGIWEVEGGLWATSQFGATASASLYPVGTVRGGLLPGLQIESSYTRSPDGRLARRTVGIQYAPIPALWALDLGYDPIFVDGQTHAVEAGTTLELALPLVTPRLAGRISYLINSASPNATSFGASPWLVRLALGFETRILRVVAFGADVDLGTAGDTTVGLGARTRFIGNLGAAFFARTSIWAQPLGIAAISGGGLLGMRF